MVKQTKPKNNKQEGTEYYDKILETIDDNINNLRKELERYKDTPKIVKGIQKNLNDRIKQRDDYVGTISEYKKDVWIN